MSSISNSSYRIFPIDQKILKVFHNYVFGYPYEICANLEKDENGSLIPVKVLKGTFVEYEPGKWRGTCNHEYYSSNILHTHPPSSYAYPSTEDILKVVKKYGKIINSLVATKWGVWVISNTTTSNIYSSTNDSYFHSFIKKHLDRMGNYTRTSEEDRKIHVDKSRELNDDDYIFIGDCIKNISEALMIKIELYSWKELKNNGLSVKGLTEYGTN